MSTFIRTLATPEQISHYFGGRAKKSTKLTKNIRFVGQHLRFLDTLNERWVSLQLPIHTQAEQANGQRFKRTTTAATQVNAVIAALQAHLRSIDRAAISGITLTRISPGKLDAHDNLRQAFKHVLDGVCAWIVRGDEFCDADRRRIGMFDDQLIGTGRITCDYEQTTDTEDERRQGIRIRLRLGA